jgi:hypothetical protein
MNSPFRLIAAMLLLLCAPALSAVATDDMQAYTDRLNNLTESN